MADVTFEELSTSGVAVDFDQLILVPESVSYSNADDTGQLVIGSDLNTGQPTTFLATAFAGSSFPQLADFLDFDLWQSQLMATRISQVEAVSSLVNLKAYIDIVAEEEVLSPRQVAGKTVAELLGEFGFFFATDVDDDVTLGAEGFWAYLGAGNDMGTGRDGRDVIFGEDGRDRLKGGGERDALYGGAGRDQLYGGSGKDELEGDGGGDRLFGQGSNDRLIGGAGRDMLFGGSGRDQLKGGAGADVLRGGKGADPIKMGKGDTAYGDQGNDVIRGSTADDRVFGGADNDRIGGRSGNDNLAGDAGDDVMEGGTGSDKVFGGVGDDTLRGDDGKDHLNGGDGDDLLRGGAGVDDLIGGDGNDTLYGGEDRDLYTGGEGNDVFFSDDDASDVFIFTPKNGNDLIRGFDPTDALRFNFGSEETLDINVTKFGNQIQVSWLGGAGYDGALVTLLGVGDLSAQLVEDAVIIFGA